MQTITHTTSSTKRVHHATGPAQARRWSQRYSVETP